MATGLRWTICLGLLSLLLWFVPLVRVGPIAADGSAAAAGRFDAVQYADRLWTDAMTPQFPRAHDAAEALSAISADGEASRKAIGRTIGVSRGFLVFLRGTGRIVEVGRSGVSLSLDNGDTADIELQTGPIFGNAVRDAPGIVDASELANSQEFNTLSAELNRLAELRAARPLAAGAAPGKQVRFVCCAEIKDPQRFTRPLKAAPVSIEFE